jgi:hypothetical protein
MTASPAKRRQRRTKSSAPPPGAETGARNFHLLETWPSQTSNHWKSSCATSSRAGQAIIESCLVVALMAMVLFGLIEIARLYMGREVLNYAATVGARAHSVGFDDFMIYKTVRVASIPIAGQITTPAVVPVDPQTGRWIGGRPGALWDFAVTAHPNSQQYDQIEASRIPLYLGAQDWGQLQPILNYADWNKQNLNSMEIGDTEVNTSVRQDVELKFAFHRAFWGADHVQEAGNATMDSHYQLYLDSNAGPAP